MKSSLPSVANSPCDAQPGTCAVDRPTEGSASAWAHGVTRFNELRVPLPMGALDDWLVRHVCGTHTEYPASARTLRPTAIRLARLSGMVDQ